jgi:hypothetical protein
LKKIAGGLNWYCKSGFERCTSSLLIFIIAARPVWVNGIVLQWQEIWQLILECQYVIFFEMSSVQYTFNFL